LLGWHSTDYAAPTRNSPLDEDFTVKTGIPVHAEGSRHVSLWGMGLTIMTFSVAIAILIFTYFYLRLNSLEWPPANIPDPNLTLPIAATVVFLASVVPMWWAAQAERQDNRSQMLLGLSGASALAIVFMGIMGFYLANLPFRHDTNAYGSVFYLNNFTQYGIIAIGVLMAVVTAFWLWRSTDDPERHVSTRYIALYWYFSAFALLLNFGILYVIPYTS
jgi:heme/copper-type cytochrome/quinol oxidase subunit 3